LVVAAVVAASTKAVLGEELLPLSLPKIQHPRAIQTRVEAVLE
jgi:hypothetical protein